VQRARRVLAVPGRLSARELRTCLQRSDRGRQPAPPPAVLLELCRHAPGLRVEGDSIIADPPLDWRQVLRGEVREVVRIFHEHGPLLPCADLEEHRARAGIPRTTFYQYLSRLPMIRRYGAGLYGLRGADITPGMIEAARERSRRAEKGRCRWHWRSDGRLELTYLLSLGAVYSGALTLPGRLCRYVEGQFDCRIEGGRTTTLTVRRQFCWGFSGMFRREGVNAGDRLCLTLGLVARDAEVILHRAASELPELQGSSCA
jgi:hypothetical protein